MREPRGLGAGPVDRYEFDRDKFIIATCAQSSAKLPPHRLTVLEGSDTQRNVEKCVRMRAPAATSHPPSFAGGCCRGCRSSRQREATLQRGSAARPFVHTSCVQTF